MAGHRSVFTLVLVVLAVGAAHGAGKRKTKEEVIMEEYLQGPEIDVEPPSKNASPLELCILLYSSHLFSYM